MRLCGEDTCLSLKSQQGFDKKVNFELRLGKRLSIKVKSLGRVVFIGREDHGHGLRWGWGGANEIIAVWLEMTQ